MPIKYRTGGWRSKIEAIEIRKETEKCVFYVSAGGGREHREAKVSDYYRWHDTWEEAHTYLVSRARREIAATRISLQKAEEELAQLVAMKKPEGA